MKISTHFLLPIINFFFLWEEKLSKIKVREFCFFFFLLIPKPQHNSGNLPWKKWKPKEGLGAFVDLSKVAKRSSCMSDPSPILHHDRKVPKSCFLGLRVNLESSRHFRTVQNSNPDPSDPGLLVPRAPENTVRSLASNYFYK